MEWHFQTDQWVAQESFGINTNELVLINVYMKASIVNDKNQTEIVDVIKRYQIYQFDSKRIDEFDSYSADTVRTKSNGKTPWRSLMVNLHANW